MDEVYDGAGYNPKYKMLLVKVCLFVHFVWFLSIPPACVCYTLEVGTYSGSFSEDLQAQLYSVFLTR